MKLFLRTASGLVLLAILVAALYLGTAALAVLVGVVMVLSLFEYRQLWRRREIQPPLLVLFPLSGFWLLRDFYPHLPAASLGLLLAGLGGLTISLAIPGHSRPLTSWAVAVAGAIWLGYLPGCVILLYAGAGTSGRAIALVLLTIGIAVLGDTGAYLLGSWIGRHPFFPRVSPKKTWEGAVAGVVLPTAVAGSLLPLVLPQLDRPIAYLIAAAASLAAIVGDLVESQLKREVGSKDSGRLIPGHGGMLDRVDSLIFVGAVVYSLLGVAHAF